LAVVTPTKNNFIRELKKREPLIAEVFHEERYQKSFRPAPLYQAVYSYLQRPAKRLRPGILLFCCGAVGGKEEQAIRAAAATEVYHTWTLVHDDIIDNDSKRRGLPTVHEEMRLAALNWGCSEMDAAQMGRNIAILAGDLQHAWSVRLLLDSAELGVPSPVILDLVRRLEDDLTNGLVAGEALDVLFAARPIRDLSENDVLEMLELKTGFLYEFAAIAGASIGLGEIKEQNQLIARLGRFARRCGTAFQLQDDILGITGNEGLLGKPVGSDIREGKRTTIVLHAYQNASIQERCFLEQTLGNQTASEPEVAEVRRILIDNQGVEYTRKLAESIVTEAMEELQFLPASRYKELLVTWAGYVVNREF
jgi:geranylgeranyl diphosphate synthase, type I